MSAHAFDTRCPPSLGATSATSAQLACVPAPADVEAAARALRRGGRRASRPLSIAFARVIASRLAGFGTTIFTEMSALAEGTGAINLGQGFPDADGPAGDARGGARRSRRSQPVPAAGPASRSSARPSPSTAARYGSARPRHRGPGHGRRDRGDRRAVIAAAWSRATRSCCSSPLRLLRGGGRDGRRHAGRCRCARPTGRSTSTRCAPRSRRARGCCCSTPRTTRPARCSPARAELDRRSAASTT